MLAALPLHALLLLVPLALLDNLLLLRLQLAVLAAPRILLTKLALHAPKRDYSGMSLVSAVVSIPLLLSIIQNLLLTLNSQFCARRKE